MPPLIYNPPDGGATNGTPVLFKWYNAHILNGIPHGAYTVDKWKVTVGSQQGGSNYYAGTEMSAGTLQDPNVTLPHNGTTCWARLWYQKSGYWYWACDIAFTSN